jgi:uncharacterized protein DUF4262
MSLHGKTVPDPADQHWIEMVAKHGHAIVMVSDAADKPTDSPAFAYSIGAYESYGAPELIIFGLNRDAAAAIINDFMEDYVAGRRYRCGVPEDGVLGGGVAVMFLEVDPAVGKGYATVADWYYEQAPFPLWQMCWPAKNGSFPWDPGYPADLTEGQPDLTAGGFAGCPVRKGTSG